MPILQSCSMVRWTVAVGALALAIALGTTVHPNSASAHGRRVCAHGLHHRTAKETIEQHLALMQAGKLDEAMCDYDENAVVVLPGQTITGLDNIRTGLSGVGGLLGGAQPQVQTLTATDKAVMITFTAFGVPCTIPDGSDTYIVEKGHIVTQTVHDTFHSAPGAVCPVAAPGQ